MNVTLQEIKAHLIVEHDMDDEYLLMLGAAAEEAAARYINRRMEDIVEDNRGQFPPSLKILILQLVASWYAVRETVNTGGTTSEVPHSLRFLADLHRWY